MKGTYYSDDERTDVELEREPMSDDRFEKLLRFGYFTVTVAGLIAALLISGPLTFAIGLFVVFIAGAMVRSF